MAPGGDPMAALAARAESKDLTRAIREFLPHAAPFPVDTRHNAKLQRETLAHWAAERLLA